MASRKGDRTKDDSEAKVKTAPLHVADERQSAILVLRSIELRNSGRRKPMTRAQFTLPMLRRLWNRPRLSPEFLEQVSVWLAVAGWCFFNAGPTYAAIRISAVKNWPRLGTKRIAGELDQVASGKFQFEDHERLLIPETLEDVDDRISGGETIGSDDVDDETSAATTSDDEE
jgi:hypothetical protein